MSTVNRIDAENNALGIFGIIIVRTAGTRSEALHECIAHSVINPFTVCKIHAQPNNPPPPLCLDFLAQYGVN